MFQNVSYFPMDVSSVRPLASGFIAYRADARKSHTGIREIPTPSLTMRLHIIYNLWPLLHVFQLSRKMSLSMESQLVNEYNKTAQLANGTSPETYKVTIAWDTLQIRVSDL